jgi:4-hydroxy-tetrahydrodipicolinate synthase
MFKGVYTAIITPFHENGSIDEESLRKLVDFQIENGISGLVPCGTTGESPTLSHEEHNKVVDIVLDQTKGRVPVIAGTGSNSTHEAVSMTKHAKEAGANGSLQVSPYYNKPTQEGLYRHFKTVHDETDFPLIIYNIKGRTGVNIETLTLMKLAKDCKNIVCVKEASGDLSQMMDVLQASKTLNKEFTVLSGDDNIMMPLTALGGDGIISVASNLVPKEMVELYNLTKEGNIDKARELHYKLLPLFKAIFVETNPIPIKTAIALQGKCKEVFRSPLCELAADNKDKLKYTLHELKLL